MSLTAIPVYLLARTIAGRRWSLIAAALAVGIPAMTYSSVIMTESAFYPVFALAAYLVITALRTASPWRQLIVIALTAVAFETRQQGIVVIAAIVLAILAQALIEGLIADRSARLRALGRGLARFWVTWAVGLLGIIGVVALQASRGRPLSGILGAYAILAQGAPGNEFRPKAILGVFFQHVAEMDLWLGVIPFLALLVLIGFGIVRDATPELRSYAVGAASLVVVMTVTVSAFAVFTNIGRIEERNLFYVGFLLLIALAWWVERGLPRQPRWFVVALLIAAALPASLPYATLLNQTAVSDTFGLFLPWAFQNRWMEATITPTLVVAGAVLAAALSALIAPRRAGLLVVLIAAYFAVAGAAVEVRTDKASQGALRQGISGDPAWIDKAVPAGSEVAVVYPATNEPLKVWQNEFFNRAVGTIYTIGAPMPAALPETIVDIGADGFVRDRSGNQIVSPYVLIDTSIELAGEVVAQDAARQMAVLRTDGPLRASERVEGVMGDGWSGGEFAYTRYDCAGGSVRIVLASDAVLHPNPVTVTPFVEGVAQEPVSVPPTGETAVTTALVPVDGACHVRYLVDPTAVPAIVFGSPDTRALGVLVRDVVYEP